ncbi:MAG: hypothetical protein E6767_14515 [Dysgonomonas sp.]|nr:hypothetical protein [Dysgonomonas sp.]
MLEDVFKNTAAKYSSDYKLINKLWLEIINLYSDQNRYYHNLLHLQNILKELRPVINNIKNKDAILFATFYHDIIYDIKSKTNEEDSSLLANERLQELDFSDIQICKEMILATKGHSKSENKDINLFIDADLSILGQDWSIYSNYMQQVRKEYIVYPDSVYNTGRKNLLKEMLGMDTIFKSEYFYDRLEQNARTNINTEIEILSESF